MENEEPQMYTDEDRNDMKARIADIETLEGLVQVPATALSTLQGSPAPQWAVSHEENNGKSVVLVNEADDPDNADAALVVVKGHDRQSLAQTIVQRLNATN